MKQTHRSWERSSIRWAAYSSRPRIFRYPHILRTPAHIDSSARPPSANSIQCITAGSRNCDKVRESEINYKRTVPARADADLHFLHPAPHMIRSRPATRSPGSSPRATGARPPAPAAARTRTALVAGTRASGSPGLVPRRIAHRRTATCRHMRAGASNPGGRRLGVSTRHRTDWVCGPPVAQTCAQEWSVQVRVSWQQVSDHRMVSCLRVRLRDHHQVTWIFVWSEVSTKLGVMREIGTYRTLKASHNSGTPAAGVSKR